MKISIKNPSDAPPGAKVTRGPRGGYYYETPTESTKPKSVDEALSNLDRFWNKNETRGPEGVAQQAETLLDHVFNEGRDMTPESEQQLRMLYETMGAIEDTEGLEYLQSLWEKLVSYFD